MRFEREEKSSSSRVPLRLQFVKLSSMMLPAELQVIPNQWQWLVELLRLHELRHSGLNKLDFHLIRAFASVNDLHFNAEDDKSISSRKRSISTFLCFIFFFCRARETIVVVNIIGVFCIYIIHGLFSGPFETFVFNLFNVKDEESSENPLRCIL